MASTTKPTTNSGAIPANTDVEIRRSSIDDDDDDDVSGVGGKKKKNSVKSALGFLYNARKRTVLGRDSLNWAKLSAFYTVFYFFLGCFFVLLISAFASILDRTRPRYYNTDSTMAVRSTSAVVGLGFRPQPHTEESIIRITNDPDEQEKMVTSLRLFRDVFLLQGPDAKTEECTADEPARDLPADTACAFDWSHIVQNNNHPCSEENKFGFKDQRPCVLIKLNKVYGWEPAKGMTPASIQQLQGIHNTRSVDKQNVYITCAGTNVADNDVLTETTYYSVEHPNGSPKFGVIPNYFFPYRNAKDHVQPFVLVRFNKLPLQRLVSVTCRVFAPNIEHEPRRMRGMVTFQLHRSRRDVASNDDE